MRNVIIGGAQFGEGYGTLVPVKKLFLSEIDSILNRALESNCSTIDVAESYVGVIERLSLAEAHSSFRYITKIAYQRDTLSIVRSLEASIEKLSIPKFQGVLIHNWAELSKSERYNAINFLSEVKDLGLTEKSGLSIYDSRELDEDLTNIGIIQAPLNFFKRDFVHDSAAIRLSKMGTEFHARSIFNQGTLLNINSMSLNVFPELQEFLDFAHNSNLNYLDAALSIYDNQSLFTSLVIGVASSDNLVEILKTPLQSSNSDLIEWERRFTGAISDPRRWLN